MRHKLLEVLLLKLNPYLQRDINEICFNQEKELWLGKNGEYERVIDEELNEQFLLNFCEQLATARNLYFNIEIPHLSCSIPHSRYRVNALHPSITANNAISINIRIPSEHKFPLENFKLGEKCTFSYEDIKNLVRDKKNILISGGTASGKTSFANSLIEEIGINERIVSVEDSPELHIKNPNKVQIVVSKNEATNYTYEKALNDCMRMSPDRLLLGEIDTRNTMLFLRLNNTGHSGSISTLHANSVEDAIYAITMNAKFSGANDVSNEAIVDYFIAAIDYVIQIKRTKDGRVVDNVLNVKKDLANILKSRRIKDENTKL
ncbi:ATPase, T2SS/T4P/T4SS family [Helicobacter sp. 10-6591]|uniref:ATPase, T2SS/T4P/T4SS family n=1 Tax=Helicobacter sp. 10-6591 TaxID=2004998 RepID=UPI000DCC7FDE|nr:ATPase, T2SS/T4P/T4SS family [Helicobacter sp. 10-6591]MCI7484347.1 Flp pilus assembly complex ATPase component TadA [Helicobacter sp.]RAX55461.1 ATPase [Helicobacter sp. 10-6591]